jgi:micrococcal nuclease
MRSPTRRHLSLVLLCLLAAHEVLAQPVTRVIDGDTIVVDGVGTGRLIGLDTPETVDPRRPVQAFGKEASEFTKSLALGKVARLDFDRERTDRFGRTVPRPLSVRAILVQLFPKHAAINCCE